MAIAEIAARQHGVVARAQLREVGLGRGAISHRLANGRLHRLHAGVYLVGHPVPAPHALEMAAILGCGAGSVLSHVSAAAQFGLLAHRNGPIDVTVHDSSNPRRPGIRVHRTGMLPSGDVRIRNGMPVTAPARTLLDLADVLDDRDLERALDEACVQRLVAPQHLLARIDRSPRRRGNARVRSLLRRKSGSTLTRSEAEERLLALIRKAGLPAPEVNARVGSHEVDFLWRAERLVVEVDGYRFHSSRRAFERDRLRDGELQAAGFRVMRVTWRQLIEEPEAVLARLAQALVITG